MRATDISHLLQIDSLHPPPLWSSLYTSHTGIKRFKGQMIVLLMHFAEKKTEVSYVEKKAAALLTMQSRLHCICGP